MTKRAPGIQDSSHAAASSRTPVERREASAMPARWEARAKMACPCGGGCPRCAGAGQPLDAPVREAMEASFGSSLGNVRLHTDADAQRAAAEQHAHAFTVGRDIFFANGRYAPGTREGATRLAHELVHTQQQSAASEHTGFSAASHAAAEREARDLGAAATRGEPVRVRQHAPLGVQRDDATGVVDMAPITITSTLKPTGSGTVPGLGNLKGQGVTQGSVTLARDEATIARNAPDPTRALPFTTGGWKGNDILTALGQYDTLPGTDSDALRCVQAVAMAARIPSGPEAVTGFLKATILDGMMSRPETPRKKAAIDALDHVVGRIEMRHATFADLMWAQEALHDLFYDDVGGTPLTDIHARMAPALDLGMRLDRMDVWCDTPAQVLTQAGQLARGEQLLVNTWEVVFNSTFDDLSEQGIEVAEGGSTVVNVNGRVVRLRRIATATRPDHSAIQPLRDHQGGHQLLVIRDSTDGKLRLYEPEVTDSGTHLETLAADGSNFTRYFMDTPDAGIYHYIQILGKLTPAAPGSLGSP
jgi:hypothetical protein